MRPIALGLGLALGAVTGQVGAQTRVPCIMQPSMEIRLASAVGGVLTEVPVDRGDRIASGQIVARLDTSVQRIELELATLRAESNIEIEIAEARNELTTLRSNRVEQLFRRQVATEDQYQEVLAERRLVALEMRRALTERALAEIEQRRVVETLALREIRSPIDGVVVERLLSPGEFVHQEAPVLRIARVDPLHVEAYLPAAMLPEIQRGVDARVRPLAPVGGSHEARILVVDQVLDAASGTFGIRLSLDNPEGTLPAGLRCDLELTPRPADSR
jgi:RND family efflux transporter MFP subunit